MTTPEPLWSNQRIATLAQYAAVNWDAEHIADMLLRLRQDYEAELAGRDKRMASLTAELAASVREIIAYRNGLNLRTDAEEARLAELEATP